MNYKDEFLLLVAYLFQSLMKHGTTYDELSASLLTTWALCETPDDIVDMLCDLVAGSAG